MEKLATPDVTIADMIGDIDPIKAARGGHDISSELTVHYGLLPRANRGIFAINELPDLAGKIQVGLFNIMQEGDVQIKGYPVRLPLDVMLVFTANPEDYTARGKIITPLKDRIGSEIRTHYPLTLEHGLAITQAGSLDRPDRRPSSCRCPTYIREIVEQLAFLAREDKKVDKRSGVSQRLPISVLENVVSNAERRALRAGEDVAVPRVLDIYAALPSITGKLELEYEGELKGGDDVARELIRTAVGKVYNKYFEGVNVAQIVQWFELGGALKLDETHGFALAWSEQLAGHPGLDGKDCARWASARASRMRCAPRPPSLFSKACTRIAASAATKSSASRPASASANDRRKRDEASRGIRGGSSIEADSSHCEVDSATRATPATTSALSAEDLLRRSPISFSERLPESSTWASAS